LQVPQQWQCSVRSGLVDIEHHRDLSAADSHMSALDDASIIDIDWCCRVNIRNQCVAALRVCRKSADIAASASDRDWSAGFCRSDQGTMSTRELSTVGMR
jgi:hypothetical protein